MSQGPRSPGGGGAGGPRGPSSGPAGFLGDTVAQGPESRGEQRVGVGWLIGCRFLLVGVSLVIIFTRQAGWPPEQVLWQPPVLLLLGCLFLNFLYLLVLPRVRSRIRFVRIQTSLDVALVAFLVYMTGGVDSNLIFLNFGPILAASSLLGVTASLLCASASAIAVALVTLAHFFAYTEGVRLFLVTQAWQPTFPQTSLATPLALLYEPLPGLVAQAVSFYLVAALSGALSARLRRAHIINEEILEKLVEGVLTIDRDGRVAFLNQRARGLLGLRARPAVAGRPWQELVPPHLEERLAPVVARLLAGPPDGGRPSGPAPGADDLRRLGLASPDRFEITLPAEEETGTYPVVREPAAAVAAGPTAPAATPVEVASSLLADDRGRVRGVTVIFIDLQERKRMEAALREAERLEALKQAAAGIAHEIRNPIASIRASAQELLTHAEEGPSAPGALRPETARSVGGRLLRVLMLESDRLNHIVNDFLAYARLRSPSLVPVPLAGVLADVVLVLSKQAQPGHRIDWACPPGLKVRADPEQLTQVLLNLGLNGLEAMPEGGELRFAVDSPPGRTGGRPGSAAAQTAVISVTDAGRGIRPEDLARIFEPFFTTKAQGTGMGLPVSKRIVEAHGGRITVDTSAQRPPPGGCPQSGRPAETETPPGAIFRVELPLAGAQGADAEAPTGRGSTASPPGARRPAGAQPGGRAT